MDIRSVGVPPNLLSKGKKAALKHRPNFGAGTRRAITNSRGSQKRENVGCVKKKEKQLNTSSKTAKR